MYLYFYSNSQFYSSTWSIFKLDCQGKMWQDLSGYFLSQSSDQMPLYNLP